MSKKPHAKQAGRSGQQRRTDKFQRRSSRNRTIVLVMAILMGLSLIAVPLGAALTSGEATPEAPDDDPIDDPDEPGAAPDVEGTGDPADEAAAGPCGETPDDVPVVDSVVYDAAPELTIDESADHVATIETTCGDIVVDLDAEAAPLAVNNLVALAEDGYYEGVVFHRVIPGFVAQVGDPAGTGCGREDCMAPPGEDEDTFPGYTFEDELGLAEEVYGDAGGYPRGVVAMANAGPDTNGSQFFITQGDPTGLPGPDYTVFGTVVEGMDVVDDIAASPTDAQDRPVHDVVVRQVTIEQR